MNVKTELIEKMEEFFGNDTKRINHAKTVLKHAEALLQSEHGRGDVVIAAAILHDVGIKEAERKFNSSNGKLQEMEGPPIASRIMRELKVEDNIIEEVCDIIAHHHTPNAMNTINFKIILDADMLTNIIEGDVKIDKSRINKIFKTNKGKEIAGKILI